MTPIVLFVFNRPDHTLRTLQALSKADGAKDSDLYIFADGPRSDKEKVKTDSVRAICRELEGFRKITLVVREQNYGLAHNVISGITEVLTHSDKVIALEDDLEVTQGFLTYMNAALNFYQDMLVFSIGGYTPPIKLPNDYPYSTYVAPRNCSWGWATWRNRWEQVDWTVKDFNTFIRTPKEIRHFNQAGNDLTPMLLKQMQGEISSWSIRFCYAGYRLGMPSVYPVASLINNRGVDGTGTHMKASSRYKSSTKDYLDADKFCTDINQNKAILRTFCGFYNTSVYRRVVNALKWLVYVFLRKK